jgi:spore germination protein GerM
MTLKILPGLLSVGASLTLTGCGAGADDGQTFSIFLKRHQQNQVLPLLAAATRESAGPEPSPRAALIALIAGPTGAEGGDGFRPSLPPGARMVSLHVVESRAEVDVSGLSADDFYAAAAAIVYSLTQLPGIDAVSLRLDGEPCCVYDQDSNPINPLRKTLFRGWPGEPCDFRTYTDAVACRD